MKQVMKNRALIITGLLLIARGELLSSAMADNVPQTIEMIKVDVQKLSTGYRASKIISTVVVNDDNVTIGKVDDLIVNPDDNRSAYVILSVGGWLGMGTHLIAIPYDNIRITTTKILLPGATKDGLKNLPEFKYSTP